jgi:hypothetical protein
MALDLFKEIQAINWLFSNSLELERILFRCKGGGGDGDAALERGKKKA